MKRSHRAVVLALLVLITLILGYIGYQRLPGHLGVTDRIYDSVSLFAFSYAAPNGVTPWELDVSRLLAAAIVTYAAIAAILLVAREEAEALRTRRQARNHVVVVGAGEIASRLARELSAGGERVIVVESDTAAATIQPLRSQGIPVVVGEPFDPEVGRIARISRATHACIVTDDDSANLEALAALRRAATEDGDSQVQFHVAIDDLGLWGELHSLPLDQGTSGISVEFVSLGDRISHELLNSGASFLPSPSGRDHVVVCGQGAVAVRTVSNAVRLSRTKGNATRVTLTGPDAEDVETLLRTLEEWIFDAATVATVTRISPEIGADEPPTLAVVCDYDQRAAISHGASLGHCLEKWGTHVLVAISSADVPKALAEANIELARVKLIPAQEHALGPSFIEGSSIELMAHAKHASDMREGLAAGRTPESDPSLRPWSALADAEKVAARRFAKAANETLASKGAALVPFTEAEPDKTVVLSDDDVEEMARTRHKLPDVPDWDQVPEPDKTKRRDEFRSLPGLLADGGYQIVREDD